MTLRRPNASIRCTSSWHSPIHPSALIVAHSRYHSTCPWPNANRSPVDSGDYISHCACSLSLYVIPHATCSKIIAAKQSDCVKQAREDSERVLRQSPGGSCAAPPAKPSSLMSRIQRSLRDEAEPYPSRRSCSRQSCSSPESSECGDTSASCSEEPADDSAPSSPDVRPVSCSPVMSVMRTPARLLRTPSPVGSAEQVAGRGC